MKALILLLVLTFSISSACRTSRDKTNQPVNMERRLNGQWELNYISPSEDYYSFDDLYPGKKPNLQFNLKESKVSGNTSCNTFHGELKLEGNKIDFKHAMEMTEMHCDGAGEAKFLELLQKVDAYSISEDNVLALLEKDIAIMRFEKK